MSVDRAAPLSSPNPRAGQTRTRILEATAQTLAKFGFARLRLDDVAEAAGVSRALVHRYFGDKTSLVRAVREHVLEDWSAELDRAIAAAPNARTALTRWLEVSLAYAARQPLLHIIFADDALAATGLSDSVALRAFERRGSRVRALLERGVAEGFLPADLDVPAASEALVQLHVGLTSGLVRGGPPSSGVSSVPSARWVQAAVRILVAGLSHAGPSSSTLSPREPSSS